MERKIQLDGAGYWKHLESSEVLEVYLLEPVNVLCVWCRDVGISYTDISSNTIWATDEWLGHIPVERYLTVNYPNDVLGWKKQCE